MNTKSFVAVNKKTSPEGFINEINDSAKRRAGGYLSDITWAIPGLVWWGRDEETLVKSIREEFYLDIPEGEEETYDVYSIELTLTVKKEDAEVTVVGKKPKPKPTCETCGRKL